MNANDRNDDFTNGIDALGRRAATALHRDIDRRIDIDAALASVLDPASRKPLAVVSASSDRRARRSPRPTWLGAAAAVALLTTGAIVFAATRDPDRRVEPADPSPPASIDATSPPETVGTDTPPDGSVAPPDASTTPPPDTTPATEPTPPPTTAPRAPATEVDALAGLVAPPPLDPVEAPAFLPAIAFADPSQIRLTQFATPVDQVTGLVQTWATATGQVLEVSTSFGGPGPQSAPDVEPVEIWPWDEALVLTTMSDGFAQVLLRDPAGSVTLWASGFTTAELLSVFAQMSLTPNGWTSDSFEAMGLVELHSGWRRTEFATRRVQWDTGAAQGELIVSIGMPDSIRTGFFGFGTPSTLDDVHGAPAMVSEPGSGTTVSWSPAPDVVIVLGYTGSLEEALALARSLEPVDETTWLAAGTDVTSSADGCDSYFFC